MQRLYARYLAFGLFLNVLRSNVKDKLYNRCICYPEKVLSLGILYSYIASTFLVKYEMTDQSRIIIHFTQAIFNQEICEGNGLGQILNISIHIIYFVQQVRCITSFSRFGQVTLCDLNSAYSALGILLNNQTKYIISFISNSTVNSQVVNTMPSQLLQND